MVDGRESLRPQQRAESHRHERFRSIGWQVDIERIDQQREFRGLRRQRGFGPQILIHGIYQLMHFGHVDQNGAGTVARHGSVATHELIESGALVFGNALPCYSASPRAAQARRLDQPGPFREIRADYRRELFPRAGSDLCRVNQHAFCHLLRIHHCADVLLQPVEDCR